MTLCFFSELSFSDKIQLALVIAAFLAFAIAVYTAIILLATLKQMQIQTKEAQFQSRSTLAINQYNIYHEELETIIERFRNINFQKNLERYKVDLETFSLDFNEALKHANGLNIEMIFLFKIFLHDYIIGFEGDEIQKLKLKQQQSWFWMLILPLLIREYRNLFHFLNEVKNDTLLTSEYKSKFYKKIEYDILQSYLRICNNEVIHYDFSCYEDHKGFNDFCCVNEFYISNNAFRYNNLDFYRNMM